MAVVVGYLPSKEGRAALAHGVDAAVRHGARLVVVSSREDTTDAVQADLEPHVGRLGERGLAYEVRHLPRSSDPADDLLGVADEVGATVIVIGLRRRSPVGKLILGSNAQRILLDATCPVLAVKGEDGP
ncbi:universal stress protein [Aquipuribacter nitratireducens]|uniref:Universal stress protein n=1 Tax=Aquipuribacter nitratireducens TaxID=650104 RepID=A0ABW0GL99_9MICO